MKSDPSLLIGTAVAAGIFVTGCPNRPPPRSEAQTSLTLAGGGVSSSLLFPNTAGAQPDAETSALAGAAGSRLAQFSTRPTLPARENGGDAEAATQSALSNPFQSHLDVITERVVLQGMRSRPSGTVAALVADEEQQVWNLGGRSDPDYVTSRRGFHPGTRVRVDATPRVSRRFQRTKLGQLLAEQLTANLRKRGYWPFRGCYEATAREHADPGGKTRLRVVVSGDGTVLQSRLLSTELKHADIAKCHVAATSRLRLERFGLRRVEVDLVVAVWSGDAPLLPLPSIRDDSVATALDAWTPLLIAIEPAVTECMRSGRERDENLWGRLALSFSLDEAGHPNQLRQFETQFGDPEVVTCVSDCLAAQEFPSTEWRQRRFVAAWRLPRSTALLSDPKPSGSQPPMIPEAEL